MNKHFDLHGSRAGRAGLSRNSEVEFDADCIFMVADAVGTPFYCYSPEITTQAYEELSAALSPVGASICYAVKANGNLSAGRLEDPFSVAGHLSGG